MPTPISTATTPSTLSGISPIPAMIPGVNGWDTAMDDSVEIGANKLRKAIEDTEIACGNRTVYELYGYSQGAIVVRKVATEIDTAERIRGDGSDIQDRVRLHFIADPATGVPARYPRHPHARGDPA